MKFLIQATQLEPTQKPQPALYDSQKTSYSTTRGRGPYQWEVSATHPEYFGGKATSKEERTIR